MYSFINLSELFLQIALSCALAFTQASYWGYYSQAAVGPDGHPIETPEVQLAKASHFAAHAAARYGVPHGIAALPVHPYAVHNALPADTPEVAAAKLQHFHDYSVAAQRNGVHVPHVPMLAHTQYPVDTPEVAAAKAAHFAAHAARATGHYRRRRSASFPLHYPVIDHNGVPVETPEVQAAKAHHFSEYARTLARPGQNIPDNSAYQSAYTAPQYAAPALAHNGVPLETPEVQAARANHFAALHAASSRTGEYAPYLVRGPGGPPAQIGPDGQPLETPEVQAVKAAHFAAHAAVRSGQYGHYGGQY